MIFQWSESGNSSSLSLNFSAERRILVARKIVHHLSTFIVQEISIAKQHAVKYLRAFLCSRNLKVLITSNFFIFIY